VSVAQKRKKNALLFQTVPRQASQQHVLRVDRYIEMYADVGLELFQNTSQLEKLNLLDGCRTGRFPDPVPALPDDLVVQCLTVCTDQEQTQITGGEFIFAATSQGGLGCTGARISDDFHRWNNDQARAVALAGLKPAEKAGTLIANIGYGPWQTAAWFNALCAHGDKVVARRSPNDKIVLKFWKTHLLYSDKLGETDDSVVGTEGRDKWLKRLPTEKHLSVKGVKVSPSKWFSFQVAWQKWLPAIGGRSLVMADLCIDKGWLLTEEDLFSPTRCGASTCGEKPAVKSKADACRKARAKVDALMNRSRNTFVTATKLICDVDVVVGINIIQHGSRAQWTEFNKLYDTLTSATETIAHCQRWASSEWLSGLAKSYLCLHDTVGLRQCGVETDFKAWQLDRLTLDHALVTYQDSLSQNLGHFVDLQVGIRAGSLAERAFYYPFKLAKLTSSDPLVAASGLREFRSDVQVFWAAQDFREPRIFLFSHIGQTLRRQARAESCFVPRSLYTRARLLAYLPSDGLCVPLRRHCVCLFNVCLFVCQTLRRQARAESCIVPRSV